MIQISEKIFCDEFLHTAVRENKLLPNPYNEYPYLIIENFISPLESEAIASAVAQESNECEAEVKSTVMESVVLPSVNKEIRKTTLSTVPTLFETLYAQRFLKHQKEIERFFGMGLTTATPLQILVYKAGDFYIKHSDDSSEIVDSDGNTVGFKCIAPERKLTTVLFGTSHKRESFDDKYSFDGGELVFNYLYDERRKPVTLYPKAGDMVVFFSNPFFSHEVKPVKSGYRLTLVQWYNAL